MESDQARHMVTLLRISRELDIVGDVAAVVNNPGELVAWAELLPGASLIAWRAEGTGRRYLCLSVVHHGAPIRGQVTITLDGDKQHDLWRGVLAGRDLAPDTERVLTVQDLYRAWDDVQASSSVSDGSTADAYDRVEGRGSR